IDPVNHVYADHQAVRAVIGGDGAWAGVGAGGISYVGAFTDPFLPNTAYVFSANLGGNAAFVAEGAMHEPGHIFGLQHQSLVSGNLLTSAETASLGETVSANLAAGTYYLVVKSHGLYGDVGTYTISGTAPQTRSPMVTSSEELAPVSKISDSSSGSAKAHPHQ